MCSDVFATDSFTTVAILFSQASSINENQYRDVAELVARVAVDLFQTSPHYRPEVSWQFDCQIAGRAATIDNC
jgi:hypothetical protein